MENLLTAETPARVTIEAGTVEEALARVTSEVGPSATIVSAERVRRGGIAGFFAREVIELIAEPATEEARSPSVATETIESTATNRQPAGDGVASAFARLLAEAESEDAPKNGGDATETNRIVRGPTVRWDTGRLLGLGVPERLVQRIAGLDPSADLDHITVLASAIQEVCGPVTDGPHRLVGARHRRLADAAGLVYGPGPLHVVLSDDPLPESLPSAPAIVSWVTDDAAPRAIALALGTGATLGWAMTSAFGAPARRVTAIDAAIALRDLMERP